MPCSREGIRKLGIAFLITNILLIVSRAVFVFDLAIILFFVKSVMADKPVIDEVFPWITLNCVGNHKTIGGACILSLTGYWNRLHHSWDTVCNWSAKPWIGQHQASSGSCSVRSLSSRWNGIWSVHSDYNYRSSYPGGCWTWNIFNLWKMVSN